MDVAAYEWQTNRAAAQSKLAVEFAENKESRIASTTSYNLVGQMQGIAIFSGLFRAVISIAKVVANIFMALSYYVGSTFLSCCTSIATKAERRERAIEKLDALKHNSLSALCGLVQAIPFFGAQWTNVLVNNNKKAQPVEVKVELVGPRERARANWARLATTRQV